MEVEAKVPPEEFEVPRVVRHDHGPHLPRTQRDKQVIPEGPDLGPEVRFPPPDLAEMFSRMLPVAGARRHDPAHPVGPPDELENCPPGCLVRRTCEELGAYHGGKVRARQVLLERPKGGAEETTLDSGDVHAGSKTSHLALIRKNT